MYLKSIWITPIVSLCLYLSFVGNAQAANSFSGQSFESCSLITSEYLTILQLSGRGLDAKMLSETLPNISVEASNRVNALTRLVQKQGLAETYSTIYSEYAACAKAVYDERGIPDTGTRENHFYYCAGENKIRYQVSMAAIIGADQDPVAGQLPAGYRNVVQAIFALQKSDGDTVLFDNLATELKHCINGVM